MLLSINIEIVITFLTLIFVIIMFFTEIIPVSFTAIIALIPLILTNILTPDEAFSGFTDSSVLLFMAMFIVGDSLFITGASQKIGEFILKIIKTEKQALVILMIISSIMSALLSNTSTAAIFIPICLSICEQSNFSQKKLLMGLVLATTLGGNLTLIGSPPNVIASSILAETGFNELNFFSLLPVGLPILIVGILYYTFIGSKFINSDEADDNVAKLSKIGRNSNGEPKWRINASIGILVLTIILMIFEKQIGIPFHVSAWIGASLNVIFRVISAEEALNAIDLSTILIFVGTLGIGEAMKVTGAGRLLARFILNIVGSNHLIVLTYIFIICLILTNFMSNTATAALIAPIAITISLETGMNPKIMTMAVIYGCSGSYGTPIGSPSNMLVYGISKLDFLDFVRVGLPMMFITLVISLLLLPVVSH